MSINTLTRRAERLAELICSAGKALHRPDGDNNDLQSFVENLQIINKSGELVPLIMNRPQEIIFEKILEAREKRIPGRFVCLKARQLGVSTIIEAIIFALITIFPRRFGLVAAHHLQSARSIFAMAQRFYGRLTEDHKLDLSRRNASRLEYAAPHYSSLQVDTAANPTLARGSTFHYVHASEVAFWDQAETAALAINQATPQNWDSLLFWESTANGMNNFFHRMWISAERGETSTVPIFLSWKEFPSYSLPAGKKSMKTEPTDKDLEYSVLTRLTRDQLDWAIQTRINQCQDSWDKFHQEYPALPSLAFAFTATPWFNQKILFDLIDEASNMNPASGRLEWSEKIHPDAPVFVESDHGPLRIWSKPDPAATYSVGMDVGEGVGGDYTVIQVINDQTGHVVATYRSNRVRPEIAGVDAYTLAAYYNFGLLGIERNGPGLATLVACERGLADYPWMTGYPNLYYQTRLDKKLPDETERLGWLTTRPVKEAMLSRLAMAIDRKEISVWDKITLLELQGFVWDSEQRLFRQNYRRPGARLTHDDSIIALAIANEMRRAASGNRFLSNPLKTSGDF